ncbi:MAG: adenylate/guanylate cyclase domain-containing protein, partial [Actinobacteria bacterium]|nr:adenylate/guanylate cyclase domain-containing protein [Actinomycetota bacterium]
INTGEVVIGNIGSERRTKYGAVGTAINTTYRIESETVGGQILVSAETYEHVRAIARVRGSVTVEFKGLDRPLILYDVAGVAGDYRMFLPDAADELLVPLRPPLAVTCFLLDNNTISATPTAARLVGLGATGADIEPEQPIPERADLKVLLPAARGHEAHQIFGKVMQKNGDTIRVAFTSLSEGAKAHVAGLIRDVRHAVG